MALAGLGFYAWDLRILWLFQNGRLIVFARVVSPDKGLKDGEGDDSVHRE